jgi:hypothetical protein
MPAKATSELDQLIAAEGEQRRLRVARVVKSGGLPVRKNVDEIERLLSALYNQLERHANSAQAFEETDRDNAALLPFTVTFENVASFALIAKSVRDEFDHIERELLEPLAEGMQDVEEARRWQEEAAH